MVGWRLVLMSWLVFFIHLVDDEEGEEEVGLPQCVAALVILALVLLSWGRLDSSFSCLFDWGKYSLLVLAHG